ncbi:MAG: hypothetical protein ACJ751_08515 [Niastella sp.]|uniref:hypothetical protein n=1 Tax=Niastella sp. TaxID=1869183 RepID=UPI00389B1C32
MIIEWMAVNNELFPGPVRFPQGINFEEQDANTFAKWGIDYLKYDYCNVRPSF